MTCATTGVGRAAGVRFAHSSTLGGGGGGTPAANVAPTVAFAFNTTTQAPVPEQAPVQPVKFDPTAAFAPSDTAVLSLKDAVQTVPQSIPGGFEVIAPLPESVT